MGKSAVSLWRFIRNDTAIDYVQYHPEPGIVQTETPCFDVSGTEILE